MERIDMKPLFRFTWSQQILAVLLAEYLINRIEADPTMVYKDYSVLFIIPAVLFASVAWNLQNKHQALHYALGIYVAVFVFIVNTYIIRTHYERSQAFLYVVEWAVVTSLGVWVTKGEKYYGANE